VELYRHGFSRIQNGPQLYRHGFSRIQSGPQLYRHGFSRIQNGPQFNKWINTENEEKKKMNNCKRSFKPINYKLGDFFHFL
jgi:virulence-associated protein VapD